jgi:hypothetical protein
MYLRNAVHTYIAFVGTALTLYASGSQILPCGSQEIRDHSPDKIGNCKMPTDLYLNIFNNCN